MDIKGPGVPAADRHGNLELLSSMAQEATAKYCAVVEAAIERNVQKYFCVALHDRAELVKFLEKCTCQRVLDATDQRAEIFYCDGIKLFQVETVWEYNRLEVRIYE